MKVVSKEEANEYQNAIIMGGLKGAAVGAGISAVLGLWAMKRVPLFKAMTPTSRTFFLLVPVLGCGVTATEWASLKFDQQTYDFGDAGDKRLIEEREKFEKLNTSDKLKIAYAENKYKIIVGAWAASLAGSFWWVNKDKYMTKSQKLVQARMYAQALTVVILLGSMVMSINGVGALPKVNEADEEYSWQSIAAEEEQREKAAGMPTRVEHINKSK